nr:penicillin-binding protein 1C [Treponema sp.]
DGKYQANISDLKGPYEGTLPLIKKMFVLPSYIEHWYTKNNFGYKRLPSFVPWHEEVDGEDLYIVFPENNSKIIIPVEIDGSKGAVVMEASTRNAEGVLYWDIDGEFMGTTEHFHQITLQPGEGKHLLTVTSSKGTVRTCKFEVLANND